MDAIFYGPEGSKYFGGKSFQFSLTASGAVTGGNVFQAVFGYVQLTEEKGIFSWEEIPFACNASSGLRFENIPVQFTGTTTRNIRIPTIVRDDAVFQYVTGDFTIELGDQEMLYRLGAVALVGGVERILMGGFVSGRAYTIPPGSLIITRTFT